MFRSRSKKEIQPELSAADKIKADIKELKKKSKRERGTDDIYKLANAYRRLGDLAKKEDQKKLYKNASRYYNLLLRTFGVQRARFKEDYYQIADSHFQLGKMSYAKQNWADAMSQFKEALQYYPEDSVLWNPSSKRLVMTIYHALGQTSFMQAEQKEAEQNEQGSTNQNKYNEAYKYFHLECGIFSELTMKTKADYDQQWRIYEELYYIYLQDGKVNDAIKELEKAIKEFSEVKSNQKRNMYLIHFQDLIGKTYLKKKNGRDKALDYFNSVLKLYEQIDRDEKTADVVNRNISVTHSQIASIYEKDLNPVKAHEHYLQANTFATSIRQQTAEDKKDVEDYHIKLNDIIISLARKSDKPHLNKKSGRSHSSPIGQHGLLGATNTTKKSARSKDEPKGKSARPSALASHGLHAKKKHPSHEKKVTIVSPKHHH